ncbi:Protein of unknown function [Alkalibacterium putridalgicola]|uniref:Maltodextrin utilization protein YvdJ n=1 Tax=Alkalibacterium putridalgicola TaxID=426703 RepID=A0A1H7TBH0_9LACT|nr:DUF1189 domain-containing protein [Alkalibacterium putridalgicola]GEK89292.1 hypothetical protein APU01nite_13310 [Alkalibacterium putridalgicola]SEL81754.1 Protein of unknown function [Alkalibacterium putridalgicola]
MKDYLKLGFTSPQHLYKAIRMSRKHLVYYFALIAFVLTLSMASVLMSVMGALREDGQEITETLPAFEITENELVVEEETESYVHQTDSFLFFFDPNDSIQEEEIDNNVERLNVPIGIGLMDDQFYLNIMGQSLPVSYEQLDGFTDEDFRDIMSEMGRFSPIVLFFLFIITYLASSFSLLYEWLIIALFANILKTLFRIVLPFRKVARMALVALSVPTIIFSVFEAFGLFLPFTFEITIGFSIYFLYASLRNLKKNRTV